MRFLISLVFSVVISFGFAQKNDSPYVILVSFDGFRHDYVERYDLPNFKNFIKKGSSAEALIPSFPSKTFPNHYTLVTGLYPGHHGLVDNGFFDPQQEKTYTMRDKKMVTDSSFYGGKPVWLLAKENKIISASYFWVGSEINENNLRPDYYYQYDQNVPFQSRINQVINWLKLPEEKRPHIITLYFSSPDTESHRYGPESEQTKQTVLSIDSLLGKFVARVDSTKLPVNIVIVSDHGMTPLVDKPETYIYFDKYLKPSQKIKIANGGTQAHIYTKSPASTDSLFNVLKKREKEIGVTVYRQKDFKPEWHYNNVRSGDLLVMADHGRYIITGEMEWHPAKGNPSGTFGVHGYDPNKIVEMRGIFYAKGPNIKEDKKVAAFQNIHVYPLIAKILGVKTGKIDGDFKVLEKIYRD